MDRVDIPEYFGGYLTWDFDERGNYVYRQFLHMCSEFLDEVEIPRGSSRSTSMDMLQERSISRSLLQLCWMIL